MNERLANEIEHGRLLAHLGPEDLWGWGTPAGQLRAERRALAVSLAAGLAPGVRALEIGCGTGMFTEMFAKTGAAIVGVDVSPDLLELARHRQLPNRVTFLCEPFEQLTDDEGFDAVIGSSVLHHLELGPALGNIWRLLKPGGRCSFAEPNLLNPQVFVERHPGPFRSLFYYVSPDETAFVRWKLAHRLREQGFDSITIVPFDWLHPRTPPSLIPAVRGVSSLLERTPFLREFAGSVHIAARKPAKA